MIEKNYKYFIILFLVAFISKPQILESQNSKDTVRLRELKDYVTSNYFSKTANVELYAEQAIALAKKINDPQSLAELYRMMGIIQYFNGKYDVALNYYLESAKLFQ